MFDRGGDTESEIWPRERHFLDSLIRCKQGLFEMFVEDRKALQASGFIRGTKLQSRHCKSKSRSRTPPTPLMPPEPPT